MPQQMGISDIVIAAYLLCFRPCFLIVFLVFHDRFGTLMGVNWARGRGERVERVSLALADL